MDEENLHGLVQFLSEKTMTDITVTSNEMTTGDFGSQWEIELLVRSADSGDSKLFRSMVGPSATLITLEDVTGAWTHEQMLCSAMEDGYVRIRLCCVNTRFMLVEDG